MSTYTGIYSNNFLGKIHVTSHNGRLVLFLGNNVEPVNLKHWSGDIFKIVSGNDPESYDTPVNFTSIYNGKAHQITLNRYEHGYGMNGTLNV